MADTTNSKTMGNPKVMEHGKDKVAKLAKKQKEKSVKSKAKAALKAKKLKEKEQDRNDWEALGQPQKIKIEPEQVKNRRAAKNRKKAHDKEKVEKPKDEGLKKREEEADSKRMEAIFKAARNQMKDGDTIKDYGDYVIKLCAQAGLHEGLEMALDDSETYSTLASWSDQGDGIETPRSDIIKSALFLPDHEFETDTPELTELDLIKAALYPEATKEDLIIELTTVRKDGKEVKSSLFEEPNHLGFASQPHPKINGFARGGNSALEFKGRVRNRPPIRPAVGTLIAGKSPSVLRDIFANGLESDLEDRSPGHPLTPLERSGTIKPGDRHWIFIRPERQHLFSEVTRVPILAMGTAIETQVIRAAENGDLRPDSQFKSEMIGIYKGDGFPVMYRWPVAARLVELDDKMMTLCAMDADKVWDYNGAIKYYPFYLDQKPCRTLQLITMALSHVEIYFLRLFQDDKLWQGAMAPFLKKQLGDTYESCKAIYNLLDQRKAFREQLGTVHDFITAASCGPQWAVTQLHKNAELLFNIVLEITRYDTLRGFRSEMCRSFFGAGSELNDKRWAAQVCTDLASRDYVVLYEDSSMPLEFAYRTKCHLTDEFADLERLPKPV